jgi:hypothetical protein
MDYGPIEFLIRGPCRDNVPHYSLTFLTPTLLAFSFPHPLDAHYYPNRVPCHHRAVVSGFS